MKDHAPSAERNRDEILTVLRTFLPTSGSVLEIASAEQNAAEHLGLRRGAPIRVTEFVAA